MTREEAIDVLKHNYPSACFTDLCEAVEIAIRALSAQQHQIPCSERLPEKEGMYVPCAGAEMSNLPNWVSVEERFPDDRQYVIVYEECSWKTEKPVFRASEAEYISDIRAVIEDDRWGDLSFDYKEIEGINSGFFIVDDNHEGDIYMILVENVKYWMPAYGLCDTTTSDQ